LRDIQTKLANVHNVVKDIGTPQTPVLNLSQTPVVDSLVISKQIPQK